jgi:predicted ATPase/DNA-binding SARP family transcriptional activator
MPMTLSRPPIATAPPLEVRVLGPLEVWHRGERVELTGWLRRALISYLTLHAGELTRASQICDELWQPDAEVDRAKVLRTIIWQLRKLLPVGQDEPDLIVTRSGGYRLDIPWDHVDVGRFEGLVDEAGQAAAAGDRRRAVDALDEGLRQWRGPAFEDVADQPWAAAAANRLELLRLQSLEQRAELLLGLGEHLRAVGPLETLAGEHPLRERFWELLMLALYRSGRQAEALRRYQEARKLLDDQLGVPPGTALRTLEHRILAQDPGLDLTHPEPTPARAGRPTAAPVVARARLDLPRTSFVGRSAELRDLAVHADEHRLVTITGPGGCGKTRLAVELATRTARRTGRPAQLVDLTTTDRDDGVVAALASALDLPGTDDIDVVCDALGDAEALLVIDNAEHVVEGASAAVDRILRRCPRTRFVVTSREELRLGDEHVWLVPTLGVPDALATARDEILASEAVQLFVERARLAPDDADLTAVARICRRLEGIPLAIELAAALVPGLAPTDIALRLGQRFALLGRGPRGAARRQQTLDATIAWSYDLLSPTEQQLLELLSVFMGDFDLAAAEAVAGRPGLDVPIDLTALRAKSLVERTDAGDNARYRLLETIRHYAAERLEPGEREELRARHGHHYAGFAEAAAEGLVGPDAGRWLERVRREFPNLAEALHRSTGDDDLETALRLAGGVRLYLGRLGQIDRLWTWLTEVIAQRHQLTPEVRLRALNVAAATAFTVGDYRSITELGEEAIDLARQLGDRRQLANGYINLAAGAPFTRQEDRAHTCLAEGGPLCGQLGDRWGQAWLHTFAGVAHRNQRRPAEARQSLLHAIDIYRSLDDSHSEVLPLVYLAMLDADEGDLDPAADRARQAVVLARPTADARFLNLALSTLGRIELQRGRLADARRALISSVTDHTSFQHKLIQARALEGLAFIADHHGNHVDAWVIRGYTGAQRERAGITSIAPADAERQTAAREAAVAAIGAPDLDRAVAVGADLSLDDVIARATIATAPGREDPERTAAATGGP